MAKLSVNIDHVATLREVRGAVYPDPVVAAAICELAGADGITVHLREDRRHIKDRDVDILRKTLQTRLNLEMALTDEMISLAERLRPDIVCLVPEKREELTTEGGLDVQNHVSEIKDAILRLNEKGIFVSLFVDPDPAQIEAAKSTGTQIVEIHTGRYCNATREMEKKELHKIEKAIAIAKDFQLICNAGHGLNIFNIKPLAGHPDIHEFNIGHSIIARAMFIGLERAVQEMVEILRHSF